MACYNTGDFSCTYDSNAGAGKNYTSLATWESDSDNDLSGTGITKLLCYDSQVHNQTISMAGSTGTDATHYRRIESASDCATPFAGKEGTGANFVYTGTGSPVMYTSESYSQFRQICAKHIGTLAGETHAFRIVNGATYSKIINCVAFECTGSGGVGRGFYVSGTCIVFGCIARGCSNSGILYYLLSGAPTIGIICCTAIGNGNKGIHSSGSGTAFAFGCYAGNNSIGDFHEFNWDSPSDYNVAGDATADLGGMAPNYLNNKDYYFGGADAIMDADCLLTAPNADGRNPYDDVTSVIGDFDDFLRNDTAGDTLFGKSIDNQTRYNEGIADSPWSIGASQYDVYASKSLTDSGAGVDAIGSLAAALNLAESGAGADVISAISATLNLADLAAGIEQITPTDITKIEEMTMEFSTRSVSWELIE